MPEESKFGRVPNPPSPDGAGGPRPLGRSSRIVIVVSLAILLILAGLLVAFAVPLRSTSETRVDWFYYQVTSGPGIDTNTSTIRGMCAPSGATTVGVFP